MKELKTSAGIPMDATALRDYLHSLINMFFKILPLWEDGESSLPVYMQSLQAEILGCKNFITAISGDTRFLSLLAILQYLIDTPDCDIKAVKREVFRAISICNKLADTYAAPSSDKETKEDV